MADTTHQSAIGGPVNKPRPEDRHPEEAPPPRPRPPVVVAPPPPPPPPPPTPRPRPPVGNGPVNRPQPGENKPEPLEGAKIGGPIGALWKSLGGEKWGLPITRVQGIADGGRGGQEVVFLAAPGAPRKIVWTARTGAQLIGGQFLMAWNKVRAGGGVLGYPTAPAADTFPAGGRYQPFEFGVIVWHPQTGAHEVHGPIHDRYRTLQGSQYGFPTTDEMPTADGRGRFNHFLGPDGSERTIMWSPESGGAWEVHGPVRDLWAQLGWERGHLGYPNGEPPSPAKGEQTFTSGRIVVDPLSGQAYADPMRWSQHFSGGGFRGDVTVTIDSSGRVVLGGRAECGWPAKFSYLVQTMIRATTDQIVLLTHKGKLTAVTQEDGDALRDDYVDDRVRDAYPTFALGLLQIDHQHSNDVTKFFGDVANFSIKFATGAVAGGGLVVLGAFELYSVLSGGGVAGGARIASGLMWLAGPNGTVIALAADGLARLATNEDTIDQAAYDVADAVFKGTLPPRAAIKISNGIGAGGDPFTFPRWDGKYVIHLGDQAGDPLRATDERCQSEGQLLIHELTHAWHYHNNPAMLRYLASAVGGSKEHPGPNPVAPWTRYSQEQQAVIVDEWFRQHYVPKPPRGAGDKDFNLSTAAAVNDGSFGYIRDFIRRRDTR